uniref:Uncharacterized protein n=1 Tax=Entomoneis paludosa TaxID=265537 RepID=A0A7S2YCG3_9STRA
MARGRALAKVVSARQTICKLFASKEIERVTWVPKQVYESLTMPSDWSTKLERETFDYPSKDEDEKHTSKKKQQIVSDDRFATTEGGASSKQQQEMLDAAQAIEVELDQLEKEEAVGKDGDDDLDDLAKDVAHAKQLLGESNKPSPKKSQPELSDSDDENNDSNDDSSSDGDEADPLTSSKRGTSKEEHTVKPTADGKDERNEGSSSSSSDDSDDDNSSDGKSPTPTQQSKTMQKFDDDSSCSSDSDSSSSSSDDDDDENDSESNNKRKSLWDADATVAKKSKGSQEVATLLATLPPMEEPEEGNGFLVAADSNDASDDADVFANAKQHIPERATGDKSQGWATQRQRPGAQFNNNRQRGGGAAHRHPQDRWRR